VERGRKNNSKGKGQQKRTEEGKLREKGPLYERKIIVRTGVGIKDKELKDYEDTIALAM